MSLPWSIPTKVPSALPISKPFLAPHVAGLSPKQPPFCVCGLDTFMMALAFGAFTLALPEFVSLSSSDNV